MIKKNPFIKKIHFFPNAITAFSLLCGRFIIFKMTATEIEHYSFETLQATAIFLLIAAAADLLDGTVARLMGAESDFGVFFDSVADSITFGVAPSVIILKGIDPNADAYLPLMTAAMIFTICGALRLVRFSVSAQESKENTPPIGTQKKTFTGLPIPAAAAAAVSANLFLASPDSQKIFKLPNDLQALVLTTLLITLGYFMISQWKFPSLKSLHIRIKMFPLIVMTVSCGALLLYSILNHFALVFVVTSWAYILVAWILSIARLLSGKKSKTLEDFEPDM